MVEWEIRLVDQGPIRVWVEDERNLSAEYVSLLAEQEPRRWWTRKPNVYWYVVDDLVLNADFVVSVRPRKPLLNKYTIGY
jgi:hypothetical protein